MSLYYVNDCYNITYEGKPALMCDVYIENEVGSTYPELGKFCLIKKYSTTNVNSVKNVDYFDFIEDIQKNGYHYSRFSFLYFGDYFDVNEFEFVYGDSSYGIIIDKNSFINITR